MGAGFFGLFRASTVCYMSPGPWPALLAEQGNGSWPIKSQSVRRYRQFGREMRQSWPNGNSRQRSGGAGLRPAHPASDVSFGDATLKVKALDYYDFAGTDICLSRGLGRFQARSPKIRPAKARSSSTIPRMAHGPRRAVDRSGGERAGPGGRHQKGIIANPNCSTCRWWWC